VFTAAVTALVLALVLVAAPALAPSLGAAASAAPCTSEEVYQSGTACYNAQTDIDNATGDDYASQSRRNDDWQKLQRGGY
jgi:hypothetical protein